MVHLERLSDPRVLARLPSDPRDVWRNRREDVVVYLRTWADVLQDELPAMPGRALASTPS